MKINIFNLFDVHIKRYRNPNKVDDWFHMDYKAFKSLLGENSEFPILDNFPCLLDKTDESGVSKGAYFHQDLFVARQIYKDNPLKHLDIGSRIDGFVAHVAVFREIEIIDIRELKSTVDNIIYKQTDLTSNDLMYIDYCDSISSLHALEHFGLGRYGDKLDPQGHLKGFKNITKMLKKGGVFYFSVPMGIQRIEFNAHRIFSLKYLIEWVSQDFEISSFSFVNDNGDFFENIKLENDFDIEQSYGCVHGCGIFVLRKK